MLWNQDEVSLCFIIQAVANDVSNADLDVDLNMAIEEMPKHVHTAWVTEYQDGNTLAWTLRRRPEKFKTWERSVNSSS